MLLKGWEVGGIFQQPASDTNVGKADMTDLWSNLTLIFSHVSLPLKHLYFPSALLILSKSLNWISFGLS